jgi:hypothetical protein
VLASFQKLPTTARTVAARVGRRFAAFAHVPYEDAHARRELVQLMDDLDIGHDRRYLAKGLRFGARAVAYSAGLNIRLWLRSGSPSMRSARLSRSD